MPAMLDDPASPTIYRVSGQPPYPDPNNPGLPAEMTPRQVTLRDRQTVATIVPFSSKHQVPESLIAYLCDQINKEIEGGDTYPMMDPFAADKFGSYWFQNFGAIMLLGDVERAEDVVEGKDCSHVCNAGFLVTDASRNRGVGRLMGEAYLDWAPKLGYTYSVFNLVYETNVASCRIWDALGFKRIGRVKGCGNLRSYPNQLIDAIIYGRDLSPRESEELVSEERFDKIKFYLKYGEYPNGADRAEKSRLRSAATHYKLLDGDKLMLKDKEVISDPARQFDIARQVHVQQHGGINKTTATIAEKYHWSRIKETVSDVIRSCVECKELGKTPNPGGARKAASSNNHAGGRRGGANTGDHHAQPTSPAPTQMLPLQDHNMIPTISHQSPDHDHSPSPYANPADISLIPPPHALQDSTMEHTLHSHSPMLQDPPTGHHPHDHNVYQPIDPQIINEASHDLGPFDQYHSPADFQALLNATEDVGPDVVDRDLEMLIEHQDDDNVMDGTDDMDGIGVDVGVGADNHGLVHKERGLYDVGFEGAGG
ncbi:Zinc finger, H2C2-type, histone UAS binding [Fusarium oxysporum f. sp. vasinfectum]|nr:Zinc finger, H2C2-type, histone UAS binding [Fusarium oxysporum f. sp. vasinfectum]